MPRPYAHRTEADVAQLEPLLGDNAEIEIYLNRKLVVRRVSDLTKKAISSKVDVHKKRSS
jgi:hypothetical protein